MKKHILIYFILLFNLHFILAQPSIQWQKCLGGSLGDGAACIEATFDGGYIIAASTFSTDGEITFNHGFRDIWIVKTNNSGIIQWEKSLGGSGDEWSIDIKPMSDGGYLLAGTSSSTDGDILSHHGSSDYWVVKLDSLGEIQWQNTYGGSNMDLLFSMSLTHDGGCILAGASNSNDGDVSGNHGMDDCWIVKLDANGAIQWKNSFGGSQFDAGYSALQTADGGYIISATSESNDGDVSGNHGSSDIWVIKLDSIGHIQWEKCFGGSVTDFAREMLVTTNDEYIVVGSSQSNDGDISGNHGNYDFWIAKLNNAGVLLWQNSLGGSLNEQVSSVDQALDSGYVLAGTSDSNNGQVSGNHGDVDSWIAKVDRNGIFQWQKSIGGSSYDELRSIKATYDGGYILSGTSTSNDGDVAGNHGGYDCWLVKLSALTILSDAAQNKSNISVYPNPFIDHTKISFELNSTENIKIYIRDSKGSFITDLNNKNLILGNNTIEWQGTDSKGNEVGAGLYIITIESNSIEQSRTIVLQRN